MGSNEYNDYYLNTDIMGNDTLKVQSVNRAIETKNDEEKLKSIISQFDKMNDD